jgi:hypothetical protein
VQTVVQVECNFFGEGFANALNFSARNTFVGKILYDITSYVLLGRM